MMNSISLPNIRRQPGFDGFFQMSDLPAVGVLTDQGDAKRFLVMMRPLTEAITQIPGVEFSFFNPENETYSTLQSPPIPIKVRP
ncbi:hypothetical protein, partial [Vibrio parahaemolyticus]|uniref:hypothetical protein n=1 Tax=Vibrio parahaemolyticus TaxID=670 RepID=UPI001A8CC05A